jgi:hypothetical protein
MQYSSAEYPNFALPWPVVEDARRWAQQFAQQQLSPNKAEQVRLNTLAVWVVHQFLETMGIATHLQASDSWNPVAQMTADIADLELPNLGRLECRPVKPHAQSCIFPPEAWSDRIGYVVVEIDQAERQARLLGFTPTLNRNAPMPSPDPFRFRFVAAESSPASDLDIPIAELPLTQLRSPEDLLTHLYMLKSQPHPVKLRVNLGEWLQGVVAAGWETVESVGESVGEFVRESPGNLSLRSEPGHAFSFYPEVPTLKPALEVQIRRAKVISLDDQHTSSQQLEPQTSETTMVLVVELQPPEDPALLNRLQPLTIRLKAYSLNQTYLPPGLLLTVLDEQGNVFRQARSRSADNYIQLQIEGAAGEEFTVLLELGETSVPLDFVI